MSRKGHKPPGRIHVVVTEARLRAMAKQMEHHIQVGLVGGIKTVRQNLSADDMRRAFIDKKYKPIMEHLIDAMDRAVSGPLQTSIEGIAKHTIANTPRIPDRYSYDHRNPRTQKYIKRATGKLITTSEDGMKEAVRAMTRYAMSKGVDYQQAANTIRDSIGLNAPQSRALANYVNGLAEKGINHKRIAVLREGQANRMLDYRAMLIAHTEVHNAQNQGQLDVWQQARDDDLLPKDSQKVWQVDGAPCVEWCTDMNREAVGLDDAWEVVNTKTEEVRYVNIPSEIHPRCHCFMSIAMP